MDVVASGPSPGSGRPPSGWPARVVRAGLAVVAVGVVVLALRSASGTLDDTAPVRDVPAVTEVPPLPVPPFDTMPGRTAIPPPSAAGTVLAGMLPPARGGPDRTEAVVAARLVLGRYCLRPERYVLSLAPQPDWRRAVAYVFGLDRSGDPPAVRLLLTWTGRGYAWRGSAGQLEHC